MVLRDFVREDIDAVYSIFSEPNFYFSDIQPSHEAAVVFVEKAINRAKILDKKGLRKSFRMAVLHNSFGLIGYCGLGNINAPDFMADGYELGAFVSRKYDGKGFGVRASKLLLEYAQSIGIKRFYGTADTDNEVSIKIQKHLGFDFIRELSEGERSHYVDKRPRMLFRLDV